MVSSFVFEKPSEDSWKNIICLLKNKRTSMNETTKKLHRNENLKVLFKVEKKRCQRFPFVV